MKKKLACIAISVVVAVPAFLFGIAAGVNMEKENAQRAEYLNCYDVRDWKISGDNLSIYTADGSEWVFNK